ncbi:hypothetical protein C8A05DRAFT_33517 [Staphylotrichum tortipilum]|uniref:Uncharacterized protein n=1 Tax=Staphylotrichum tortipilum TaxID=2831512 RepID=A0AAN6RTT6_9PEZI|nr:hypothetical protein C8A05DRAFT_33517 [Staphylotrichum longicolle]
MLTYKLSLPHRSPGPRSAALWGYEANRVLCEQDKAVQLALAGWKDLEDTKAAFCYPLKQHDRMLNLSLDSLEERDAAVCRALCRAAPAAGFAVFLARGMLHRERRREDYGITREWTAVERLYIAKTLLINLNCTASAGARFDDNGAGQPNMDWVAYERERVTVAVLWAYSHLHFLVDQEPVRL